MIERGYSQVSLVRQCELLGLDRSSMSYEPLAAGPDDLELVALMGRQCLKTTF
jgi:hypothetical protein